MEDDYLTPIHRALDDLILELWGSEGLSREQCALVEVYSAIGTVSNGGLHTFWGALEDESAQIIECFRIVREHSIADMLESTRFLLSAKIGEDGMFILSDEESDLLSTTEDKLLDKDLVSRLWKFAQDIGNCG